MNCYPMDHVEMHITHRCNLSCKFCAHYCDYHYGGDIPFETGAQWITAWSRRIAPKSFHLLGGEPLLSSAAERYVYLAAERFPQADRGLVSNGVFFSERLDLVPALINTRTCLLISLHADYTAQQLDALKQSLKLAVEVAVGQGMRLRIFNAAQGWRRLYQGEGADILPFDDGDERMSCQNCAIGNSPVIHDGKLWKCPPLAFLPCIVCKLKNPAPWEPYLKYQPVAADASDQALEAFLKRDSDGCGMCAAHPRPYEGKGVPKELLSYVVDYSK